VGTLGVCFMFSRPEICKQIRILLSLALSGLIICGPMAGCSSSEPIYPYEPFRIKSAREMKALEGRARHGDADAAKRLAAFYLLVMNDRGKAIFWFRVAASYGDEIAKDTLKKLAQPFEKTDYTTVPSVMSQSYALFSWNRQSNDFCFAFIPADDRDKFIRTFRRLHGRIVGRCGVNELEAALNSLPKSSYVRWNNADSVGLNYPPDKILDRMMQLAKSKGVHLSLEPATD
jgi:hypothetical protein